MRATLATVCAAAALSAAGHWSCTSAARKADRAGTYESERPLYWRLGGEGAIRRLVDDLTPRVMRDSRVNFVRAGEPTEWDPTPADLDRFKLRMEDLLAEISGGPRKYGGGDMRTVHRGMRITDAQFQAFVEDMRASLAKAGIPGTAAQELLSRVEDYRSDIVEAGPLGRPAHP